MASKVYRINGQIVTQAEYLDEQARRAGYADRRDRERHRRAVQRARKLGVSPPQAPPGSKPYRPAVPGPGGRKRGQRYAIGQSGGTYMRTTGKATARREILRASRQGKRLVIHVEADAIERTYARDRKDDGRATIAGVDATDVADAIRAEGGDLNAALEFLFASMPEYSEVSGITSYEIKAY